MDILVIAILFFIIATIYSTVGFGGGSSYIAVLLASSISIGDIRFVALICNVIVVSYGTFSFYKSGLLPLKKIIPLVVLSIPFSFWGGYITPDEDYYRLIAGIVLILAALTMLFATTSKKNDSKGTSPITLSGIGGGIGFVSGFIGIGGGIFLSPILNLIKWENAKIISAVSSFFILVNSIAGLLGQSINSSSISYSIILVLGASVFLGGLIGNRLNIYTFSIKKIRLISAILIGLVGINLLLSQLM